METFFVSEDALNVFFIRSYSFKMDNMTNFCKKLLLAHCNAMQIFFDQQYVHMARAYFYFNGDNCSTY